MTEHSIAQKKQNSSSVSGWTAGKIRAMITTYERCIVAYTKQIEALKAELAAKEARQ